MIPKDRKPEDATQRKLDEVLEEGLEDTFPASDAVSVTQPAATPPEEGLEAEEKGKKTDKSA
jgi:hypothetical protein